LATDEAAARAGFAGRERAGVLELRDVVVAYGATRALDGVSMTFGPGGATAIIGPNGAGKSSVLKAILRRAPVQSGRIVWNGQDLHGPSHEIVRAGVTLVPQGRGVFDSLSVEENLDLGCLSLRDPAERKRRRDRVWQLFPVLEGKRRELAEAMSGGEQQMLALGRGLMADPAVLLLDEPTLGLSPALVRSTFATISEIKKLKRAAIVIVEHNVSGVLRVADRAYVLERGRVTHEGTADVLRQSDVLAQAFLGSPRA
jgi:branched-chain amino acid transport system ATP-binding protein